MINTYEKISTKIQAIQFLNDSETRADVQDLLGDKFIGWQTDTTTGTLFVHWRLGKYQRSDNFAAVTDYIFKDNSGLICSLSEQEFNKQYKKLWD